MRSMYFARTLLVPVLLIGGLVEMASAQHKYVFPQFVFGGGWASTGSGADSEGTWR